MPNTKVKILTKLLSDAIDEFAKVNKIKGIEFSERLENLVDAYNDRRRDEAYAKEVLDEVAEQLTDLLQELKTEQQSFDKMGITFEEKAFYDILLAVSKKYKFEYPEDKMIELAKRIKETVDDNSHYTDWASRDDIKAHLQFDIVILLDEFGYPVVVIDQKNPKEAIAIIPIKGSLRTGNMEIIFDRDLNITHINTNVDLTLGESMTKAGTNTMIGMGTVFVMLIVISFIIRAMGIIPKLQSMSHKKEESVDNAISGIIEREEGTPAYEVLETCKGKDLEYKEYEPLYQCAADSVEKQKKKASTTFHKVFVT